MKQLALGIVTTGLLLLACVLFVTAGAQALASPTVTAIIPNTGPNDQQTEVTITGHGLVPTSTATLDGTPLLAVTFVDSTTLEARVPFGLATGVYTLTITNPQSGTLTNAFTVTAGTVGWASGGPYGGRTRDLAIHPTVTDTVYVAVEQSGLYRSTNGGERWEQVMYSSAMPVGFVHVWAADPAVVFFGGDDGLYRSDQGGDVGSWYRVTFAGEPGVWPNAMAIAPSDPYAIYCAMGGTLFYSANGGSTWLERSTGLPTAPWELEVSAHDADTVYASFQDGTLYRTTDAGLSWVTLPFSIPVSATGEGGITAMAADPYRLDTLWLGSFRKGLHRSSDGGQTFVEVVLPDDAENRAGYWDLAFDPNQDRFYVGTIGATDALYYTDDAEVSWHGLGLNNQGGAGIAVAPGDSDTIYTTWAGVRKSTDGGETWILFSEGMAAIAPVRIAVSPLDPQRVMAVADADGAFGTHNGGNEWDHYPIDSNGYTHQHRAVALDPISGAVAYVGGTGTVFKTVDGGRTWQEAGQMPLDGLPPTYENTRPLFLAVHPLTPTTVLAGVSFFGPAPEPINAGALYRSDAGGDSWTRVAATGPISQVNHVVLAPGQPETLYLGTGSHCHWCLGDGIWRSRDGGRSWEHPDSELRGLSVLALAVHPKKPDILLAGVWPGDNVGDGVYRSTDGGDSWQQTSGLDDGLELQVPDIAYDPVKPHIVYAATHGGLRISFNGGLSWQPYPGAMGALPITALAVTLGEEGARLYVGTVGGTIVAQGARLQGAQAEPILGAGVFVGKSRWYQAHLPLVAR